MSAEVDARMARDADGPAQPGRVSIIVVAVVFGLLHLYPLLTAVSNLVGLPAYYQYAGFSDQVPWWLLILGLALPPVCFVGALLLGRGRILAHRAALLAVSLATVNALTLGAAVIAPVLLISRG